MRRTVNYERPRPPRDEEGSFLAIITPISSCITFGATAICLFLLPYQAFLFPPFLFATVGEIVLFVGIRASFRGRSWGIACELVGCVLEWCCYGPLALAVIQNARGITDIFRLSAFDYLMAIPMVLLTVTSALLIVSNVLGIRPDQ